jgi:hypothetical protein
MSTLDGFPRTTLHSWLLALPQCIVTTKSASERASYHCQTTLVAKQTSIRLTNNLLENVKTMTVSGDDEDDARNNSIDDIGISTVGERKQNTVFNDNNDEDEHVVQITRIIDKYLTENSEFFDQNTPRTLPEFSKKEIRVGRVLGEGEFGTVCQI